jgi:hypothetical protein
VAIWFQVAIASNVLYWAFFVYQLFLRRWTGPALSVGLFHMLFAALVSVAPIRALLDPNYMNFGLGVIQVNGQAAALPAALVLSWTLLAAWLAVGKGKGRWMTVIAAGDAFLALNIGASLLLAGDWRFQLGEYLTITGVAAVVILLFFLTGPFVASAIWATRQTGSEDTTTPLAPNTGGHHGTTWDQTGRTNGLKYIQARA